MNLLAVFLMFVHHLWTAVVHMPPLDLILLLVHLLSVVLTVARVLLELVP